MADNILRIGAEFDVSQIVAASEEAAKSLDSISTSATEATKPLWMVGEAAKEDWESAKIFGTSWSEAAASVTEATEANVKLAGSIGNLSAATLNLLYPTEEAATAVTAESEAVATNTAALVENTAAANVTGESHARMGSMMGIARAEAGALDGSVGMVTGGLARLAAQSASLGPIIQAAFIPLIALFAGEELARFIDKIAEAEIKLADLSEASGISVVSLSELGHAAEASGAKSDDMTNVVKKLGDTIVEAADGSKTAIASLHQFGIEVEDWHGIIPPTMTVLFQMADYLHQNAGNAEIMRAAMHALGTESIEFTNLLASGSQGLSEQMQKFGELSAAERDHIQDAKDLKEIESQLVPIWDEIKLAVLGATLEVIKYKDAIPGIPGILSLEQLALDAATESWHKFVAAIETVFPALDKLNSGLGPLPPQLLPPKPPEIATPSGKDKKESVEAEREQLTLINDRIAAEKSAAGQDEQRVVGLRLEISALDSKKKLEEEIATVEGRSVSTVDQEFVLKRIQLTNELKDAEAELATHRDSQADRYLEEFNRIEEKQVSEKEKTKELATAEAEFSSKMQMKVTEDTIKDLEKTAEAVKKYTEEADKTRETTALHTIDSEEKSVSETAKIEEEKLKVKNISEIQRIRMVEQINAQELEALKKLEDDKFTIQLTALQKQETEVNTKFSGALTPGQAAEQEAEIAALNAKIEELQSAHVAKMDELNQKGVLNTQKAATDTLNAWMKAFDGINKGIDTSIKGVMLGTQTMGQAFVKMGQNIEISVIQSLAKVLLHHIETEAAIVLNHLTSTAAQTDATNTGQAEQTAAVNAGAASRQDVGLIADIKSITSSAATAAANVYKWVVTEVPWPAGPVVGAAAAGAAFASVLAFKALASAEQGAIVPADMMMNVHREEMVLPRNISLPLQAAIPAISHFSNWTNSNVSSASSASSSVRNGDTHIHIAGGSNMGHDDIIRAVKAGIRKGQLSNRV